MQGWYPSVRLPWQISMELDSCLYHSLFAAAMLSRLPAPLRSLLVSNPRVQSRSLTSAAAIKHAEPLRILFCGSDDFSIKSLHALHNASLDTPGLIDEIHVAHRPPKPTGRGLKVLREGNCRSGPRAGLVVLATSVCQHAQPVSSSCRILSPHTLTHSSHTLTHPHAPSHTLTHPHTPSRTLTHLALKTDSL